MADDIADDVDGGEIGGADALHNHSASTVAVTAEHEPTSITSGDTRLDGSGGFASAKAALEQQLAQVEAELLTSQKEVTSRIDESDSLRSRAAAAEGRADALEKKLRQQVARLKQLSAQQQQQQQQQQSGGAKGGGDERGAGAGGGRERGGGRGGGGDSDRMAAMQNELKRKQKEVEDKDSELAMLKEMVRNRQQASKARGTRGPRIRTDAPMQASSSGGPTDIEASPSTGGGPTPSRSVRGPAMPTSMAQVP